ncbi:MAG: helix-turn-helix domain-containing protein [Prevotella sp.]|nr:helix-turn-helix domain-containing protein [Prevotella sp.]
MRTTILILSWLCLVLHIGAMHFPQPGSTFRNLTYRDGLSGTSVTDIMTDHNGEIWLATSNGVNTYNGKRLVSFRFGDGARHNFVYHIYEDDSHHIFATSRQGIYCIGYGDKQFQRIVPEIQSAEALLPWTGDTLFIGNRDGLHIYDGKKLKTILIAETPMDLANSVRDIRRGTDGRVWFVSKLALNVLTPQTGKVESWPLADKMPVSASLSRMAISKNKCYIGTKNDGLYVCDLTSKQVKAIPEVGYVVTSLKIDKQGKLCVGTDGSGAYLINMANDSIERHFRTDANEHDRIISNAVYCYYRDDHGVDWYGYFRYGLTHTFHLEQLFRPYRYKSFTTEGMSVRCYSVDKDYIMIGTTDGCYFIDPRRDIVHHITPSQLAGGHIVTSVIRYGDYYYIATYDGGLRRFNPQTMAVSKVPVDQDFDHITVTQLVINPSWNSLGIATSQGLFVLRPDGTLVHFDESNSKLGRGTVSNISFDAKGNGWLSSEPGLTRYDIKAQQFQQEGFPAGFFNDVKGLRGAQGHDGLQFFYNSDDIYYTDTRLQHFGRLEFSHLLDKELRLSFVDDMQGHYWVSNERGLFRIDYDLKHLQYFGEGEGIMCQFITDGSLHIDHQQQLWMGTSNGLLHANLKDIEKWQKRVKHNILLYQIRVGGELLTEIEEAMISDQKRLTLTWNFTSEALQALPVVTDYSRSAGRIFEYRIDHKGKWVAINDEQPLEVRGLMLGRHLLSIRVSGLQNTAKDYELYVVPSWTAVVELILLLVAIGLFVWWRSYRRNTKMLLSERDSIEEALVEMEQAHEMTEQDQERQKYERVRMNEAECEKILCHIHKYMETQKPYQNPELKMADVAEVLQVSPSKLSQVFNLYLNESYYEFINNYRLEEFKRRVDAGDNERFTLLALSEQCGFKKSSFFATFRRVEGMTPTEYLKKKHKL